LENTNEEELWNEISPDGRMKKRNGKEKFEEHEKGRSAVQCPKHRQSMVPGKLPPLEG
jgi:hypothetical protein